MWHVTCLNHASSLSLCSYRKRSLWTHREVDQCPNPAVGLVLLVGDVEKFPQAFGFESLDPFSEVSKQRTYFTAIEEDGGSKRLVELEFACEADSVAHPDPV